MNLPATVALGIGGALLGGFLYSLVRGRRSNPSLRPAVTGTAGSFRRLEPCFWCGCIPTCIRDGGTSDHLAELIEKPLRSWIPGRAVLRFPPSKGLRCRQLMTMQPPCPATRFTIAKCRRRNDGQRWKEA